MIDVCKCAPCRVCADYHVMVVLKAWIHVVAEKHKSRFAVFVTSKNLIPGINERTLVVKWTEGKVLEV